MPTFEPSQYSFAYPNGSTADMKLSCLKRGASGPHVDILHSALKSRNYSVGGESVYGDKTIAAVRKFQGDTGIYADGVTGPQTWAQLGYQGLPCSGGSGSGGSFTYESKAGTPLPGQGGGFMGSSPSSGAPSSGGGSNTWFWVAAGGGFLFVSGLVIYHYKDEIEAWAAGQPMGSKHPDTKRSRSTSKPKKSKLRQQDLEDEWSPGPLAMEHARTL